MMVTISLERGYREIINMDITSMSGTKSIGGTCYIQEAYFSGRNFRDYSQQSQGQTSATAVAPLIRILKLLDGGETLR